MRLTNETDYALRITGELAAIGEVVSAKELAERTDVTLRFALKILHKLSQAEIVDAKKGAQCGYYLKKSPSEISLGQIVETIEGPIHVSNCAQPDYMCPRASAEEACRFHHYFCDFNSRIRRELYETHLSDLMRDPAQIV